jgi:hypothetical protein
MLVLASHQNSFEPIRLASQISYNVADERPSVQLLGRQFRENLAQARCNRKKDSPCPRRRYQLCGGILGTDDHGKPAERAYEPVKICDGCVDISEWCERIERHRGSLLYFRIL